MSIFTKKDDRCSKFYVNDFINDYENKIKGKMFATDEDAKQYYLKEYGEPKDESSLSEFIINNSSYRICPKKLTKNQKIKLLLLLKETNCEADIYMSYQDILSLKRDTNN